MYGIDIYPLIIYIRARFRPRLSRFRDRRDSTGRVGTPLRGLYSIDRCRDEELVKFFVLWLDIYSGIIYIRFRFRPRLSRFRDHRDRTGRVETPLRGLFALPLLLRSRNQ